MAIRAKGGAFGRHLKPSASISHRLNRRSGCCAEDSTQNCLEDVDFCEENAARTKMLSKELLSLKIVISVIANFSESKYVYIHRSRRRTSYAADGLRIGSLRAGRSLRTPPHRKDRVADAILQGQSWRLLCRQTTGRCGSTAGFQRNDETGRCAGFQNARDAAQLGGRFPSVGGVTRKRQEGDGAR